MKKLVVMLMLVLFSMGVYAQQGQSSAGLTIGYGFDTNNATLGLDYRYNLTDEIRLTPSLTHFVKNDGLSAWAIDMNVHYVFKLSEMFGFYPLAGLSLSFWKSSLDVDWEGVGRIKASDNATRFGANIGLGAEVYATDRITVGIEAKYNIVKTVDQALLGVRVGYNF